MRYETPFRAILAGGLAAIALLGVAVPANASGGGSPVPTPADRPDQSAKGGTIVMWSSDGRRVGPLDASDPENVDLANFDRLADAAGIPVPTDPQIAAANAAATWTCSLWVPETLFEGSSVQAETSQTCVGVFSEHWTGVQFQRDSWTGWRNWGGSAISQPTSAPDLDLWWTMGCTGSGTYNYRLLALGYTEDIFGGVHTSTGQAVGDTARGPCGN